MTQQPTRRTVVTGAAATVATASPATAGTGGATSRKIKLVSSTTTLTIA